jgi:choline dehydrogenase-like flavoprotein
LKPFFSPDLSSLTIDSYKQREYDVIIVGSGLGGSTIAYRLAQRGRRVLVVEKGDYLPTERAGQTTPLGPYKSLRPEPQLVGGPSKFYGAAMYRLRESDFRAIRHERGESPAWPITYADLEPYYGQAEQLYRVHGAPDGDLSDPPRSLPYPHPPIPVAPLVERLMRHLRESGTSVAPIPRAIDYGTGGKCVLCPTCDAYYCHLDAKLDADIAALRPALASGRAEVRTKAECIRILTTADGTKAVGVVIRKGDTEESVHASVVVISAGVGPSASLLVRSRNSKHPHGLGNSTGCVGRYFGAHTTGMIFPMISLSTLPAMHSKSFAITSYYDGAPDWPYPVGVIQAAGQIPFWETDAVPQWMKLPARIIGKRSLYCFYMTEALPTRESGFRFDGDRISAFVPPLQNLKTFEKLRILARHAFRRAGYQVITVPKATLWHTVGTVRFGADPATSVLDPNCKVHDIDNLYVVDGSVLPSAGAVNTGLTIAALALRAGDYIAGLTPKL